MDDLPITEISMIFIGLAGILNSIPLLYLALAVKRLKSLLREVE